VTDLRRPLRIGMVCPYSFDVPGGSSAVRAGSWRARLRHHGP
jgi:hypothetical protein